MLPNLLVASIVVGSSAATAFSALLVLSSFGHRRSRRVARTIALQHSMEPTVFLLDDGAVMDATAPAYALLEKLPAAGSDWDRLLGYLAPRFTDIATRMAHLADEGTIDIVSESQSELHLQAEHFGDKVRLTLADHAAEGQGIVIDSLSLKAQNEEVYDLREALGTLPVPVWRTDGANVVTWANHAYLSVVTSRSDPAGLVWPLPALFEDTDPNQRSDYVRRLNIPPSGGTAGKWFESHSFPSAKGKLHFALPADSVVRAERTLREFVQTLAKTFAHLSVGLAVFDRQRQLAVFNPALADLTTLTPDFLSARPTLSSFLDRLREARMVPEPKDFGAWKQVLADLEEAAASGQYEETWSLASGQTYRVSGRPHPDGAVAFLFEDISAEISLTRRFRAEVELGLSVIDALDDAVAVFSGNGDLVMSNAAHAKLWGFDPSESLNRFTILDATRTWQLQCLPSPVWGDLRDFFGDMTERTDWGADLIMKNGRRIGARFSPLPAGAVLVRFTRTNGDRLQVHRSRRPRQDAGRSQLDPLDA